MTESAPLTAPHSPPGEVSRSVLVRSVLVSLVAMASLVITKLALFAAVGCLLGFVSLPAEPKRAVRWLRAGLLAGGLCATLGVFRFLVLEAMPGMVEGGTTATEQREVSRLREILFAEDAWRKNAFVDPDGDHVGSAGLLGELTGQVGVRGGARSDPPVLQNYPELVATRLGPAANIGGYLVIVCLPTAGGGFSATPGEPIDEERAEREFYAYAWPAQRGQGLTTAYFLDQNERILLADSSEGAIARLLGPDAAPSCDDVSAPSTAAEWRVWRHKKPRTTLPYDQK